MEDLRIFDFHLHPGYDFHENDTDRENFIALLRRDGITGAAGSFINLDMCKKPVEEYEWRIPELNAAAWEWHDAYPDFFVPGIHVHPDFLPLSFSEMEKHKAKGGVLVGELVYYMMGYQYTHPNVLPLFDAARQLDLVVNVHPSKNMAYNRILTENLPGLKLVLAHLGGYGLTEDFLEEMKKNENLYVDVSAYGVECDGLIRDAVNQVGSERILYGTDFPGSKPDTKEKRYVNAILAQGLRDEDLENILFRNAERLLNL